MTLQLTAIPAAMLMVISPPEKMGSRSAYFPETNTACVQHILLITFTTLSVPQSVKCPHIWLRFVCVCLCVVLWVCACMFVAHKRAVIIYSNAIFTCNTRGQRTQHPTNNTTKHPPQNILNHTQRPPSIRSPPPLATFGQAERSALSLIQYWTHFQFPVSANARNWTNARARVSFVFGAGGGMWIDLFVQTGASQQHKHSPKNAPPPPPTQSQSWRFRPEDSACGIWCGYNPQPAVSRHLSVSQPAWGRRDCWMQCHRWRVERC